MKRPLVNAAIICAVVFLLQLLGFWTLPMAAAFFLLCFYPDIQMNMNRIIVIAVIVLYALALFVVSDRLYDQTKRALEQNGAVNGHGIVKEVMPYDDGCLLTLEPWWDSDGTKMPFALNLQAKDGADIGQVVAYHGTVKVIHKGYNEGGFNLERYYREKGIVGQVIGGMRFLEESGYYAIGRWMDDLRHGHHRKLQQMLPPRQSAIVAELLLGIEAVEDDDRVLFRDTGTIHILAISGLHVGLVAFLLMGFLGTFIYDQRVSAVIVLVIILLYCSYTGGSIATVRAAVMIALHLGHRILYRRYDGLTSLAFAFLFLIHMNPFQITGVGFLLSFGAVISILIIVPLMNELLPSDNPIGQSLKVLTAIQIGLLPILANTYHQLPLYGFIANLLILPVIAVLIGIAATALALCHIHQGFGEFMGSGAFWLSTYMLNVVEVLEGLPLSTVTVPSFNGFQVVLYYLMLLMWVTKRTMGIYLCSVILVSTMLIGSLLWEDDLIIDMMDVGNGDAMFLRYRGEVMLVDGGGQLGYDGANTGEKVLLPYLRRNGIRKIDTVMVSHSDFDHIYGIIELMDHIPIERILLASVYESFEDDWSQRLIRLADQYGTEIVFVEAGHSITIEDMTIKILYPFDADVHVNNNSHSLVSLLILNDFQMLLTGDAYCEDEYTLMDAYPEWLGELDVLKIAHHGSKTSSSEAFLKLVSPEVALISVGRHNLYGHPAADVVKRIEAHADYLRMTKDSGQITLVYDGEELTVCGYLD